MALDALEVLTKAIKESGIYSVFDNVTGVINRNNAKEIGLEKNYQATDAGGKYGNTFKNAFNWSVNRGGGASSFLQDMTTARKVKPGEDKDRVYAENILKNYRSQSENNPEMVAALDLLTGRLDPQEARDVATYGGLSRNIKQAESAVQQTQNQLNVYQQSALQRGETQNTRDFNIANTQNQLAKQKARLAGLVNQAGQTFNKELNISSTVELKDFSNLTDRYGLGATTYDPMQLARSKISAGEQLSAGDLIALASENQGGQITGKKTARQLEQELGLQEGIFRKTLVDDLGREYTSFSNFFTDDPVIKQQMAQSASIYNSAGSNVNKANQLQAVDLSKYQELGELWKYHPQNKQGKSADLSPKQRSMVLNRYNDLSQKLSDEVGGGELATEAMMALGAVGGIGNGLTAENLGDPDYYKNLAEQRKNFLADPDRENKEAFDQGAYRFASVLMGDRPASLDYVQSERLRNIAGQYGTPEQYNYLNQLAGQTSLQNAQKQSLFNSLLNPEAPRLQNVSLDPTQQYLNMLDTNKYLDLVNRLFNV